MIKQSIADYLNDLRVGGFESNRTFVFIDTCSFLDLIRDRKNLDKNNITMFQNYNELLQRSLRNEIFLVSSYMVLVELHSNFSNIKKECIDKYNETINKITALQNLAIHYRKIKRGARYDSRFNPLSEAEYLYNELIKKIVFLEEKIEYDQFAMFRVEQKLPPAHKKHEYKDAFIWGTCLDFKTHIVPPDRILFFTTNTEDYTIKTDHPEFAALNAQLTIDQEGKVEIVTNINHLIHLL